MLKLHPIKKDIKTVLWCGPGALATVSGKPASVVMQALREVSGRQTIKGVSYGLLERGAARLGLKLEPITPPNYPTIPSDHQVTLARWTKLNRGIIAKGPVILCVSHHYVTVTSRLFNDNWTKTPVPLKKAPRRRARVKMAWRVVEASQPAAPVVIPPKPVAVARPKPARETERLAAANLVLVEHEPAVSDVIWIYPPPGLESEEADRYSGDHACYDWFEALERVKNYVADLTKHRANAIVTP